MVHSFTLITEITSKSVEAIRFWTHKLSEPLKNSLNLFFSHFPVSRYFLPRVKLTVKKTAVSLPISYAISPYALSRVPRFFRQSSVIVERIVSGDLVKQSFSRRLPTYTQPANLSIRFCCKKKIFYQTIKNR